MKCPSFTRNLAFSTNEQNIYISASGVSREAPLATRFGAFCFPLQLPTILEGENVMHNALAW